MAPAPPPPIRMGMRIANQGAREGLSAGKAHPISGHLPSEGRGGGGAGTNPITKALGAGAGDAAGFVPTQDVPIRGLGTALLNVALHPTMVQRAEEEQARLKGYKESEAQEAQGKAQAAIDSYNQAMKEGSARGENPNQTLARWISTPDGVKAMTSNSAGAVAALHGAQLQAQAGNPPTVIPLPMGLTAVQMGDGSTHVLTPKQMESSQSGTKPVMGPLPGGGRGPGTFSYDPETGRHIFTPAQTRNAQGEAVEQTSPGAKPAVTPQAQLSEAEALRTVLESGQKMLNNLGATGSLGWGSAQRQLAINTPLTGAEAEAYNQAYNQMQPALVQLNRVQGQSKLVAQLAMAQLPTPGKATAFLLNQNLPGIMLQARERVGDLNKGAIAANKTELIARTEDTVRTFDANPAKMADLRNALQTLATAPNQLPPDMVKMLGREAANGRLPYDATVGIARQMEQLGLMDKGQIAKATAADPNFTQAFTPRELRADRIPPPDHLPQPGIMQTPPPLGFGGGAAGPSLPGQGALPAQAQQPQAPAQPGQVLPTQTGPQQGFPEELHPPIATPAQGPTSAPPQPQSQSAPQQPTTGPLIPSAPGGSAPAISPQAAAAPGASPSMLSQLNPISSAMAAEAPPAQQQPINQTQQPELTSEEKQLQADIAQAAKIAPDPGTPDLIEATRRAIASPETAVEPVSGQ